jgi:hypothetical protein
MTDAFKNLIESIGQLSTKEKALAAHCLLSAMDSNDTDEVEKGWIALAESRSLELETGSVKPMSWAEIKQEL